MPNLDKTGPQGKGPRTGRGMGDCSGTSGKATGRGLGQGMGRGRGFGRFFFNCPFWKGEVPTKEEKREILEEEKKLIEEELKNL